MVRFPLCARRSRRRGTSSPPRGPAPPIRAPTQETAEDGLVRIHRQGQRLGRSRRAIPEGDVRFPERADGARSRPHGGGGQRAGGVGAGPEPGGVPGAHRGVEGGGGRGHHHPRGDHAARLRDGARGGGADAGPAALRRADRGRGGPPPGLDRGDGDGGREDAGRHSRPVPERARGQAGVPRHRQRLPGAARLRVDGTDLHLPRPHLRGDPEPDERGGAPEHLRARHRLRHEQRVRLRLPARQHEDDRGRPGAAPPGLRDHRRDRLDPDRRGADPADHLRPRGARPRQVQGGRHGRAQAGDRGPLRGEGEGAERVAPRGRDHRGGEAPRGGVLLHRGEHRLAPLHRERDPRLRAVREGARVPRGSGRSGDRRRVHRPQDDGAALVRRPPPGGGDEGRDPDQAGEPDAGHDHLPELLPPLREALRHDRHRDHRGGGVPEDLRPRRDHHPHQSPRDAGGPGGHRLPHRAGEVGGDLR